ncbi:MAG: hypothetical protein QOE70_1427 [Chthoniobacter sp.]|nr:hypothetical protein [Chthoniobacter sp.]
MCLDPSLAGAFIDGGIRHRLLGVPVFRFSLWHLLLLQALDSPFLRHGEVGLFELRTAVGVCRLRFGQSRVRRPWLGPLTLARLCRKGGLRREVCEFLSYTADYLYKPEYSIRAPRLPPGASTGPQSNGAPEILKLAGDIIGWSQWPEAYVWELPPGRAHWYRALAQRAMGADVDFVTPEDREFNEAMKRAGLKPRQANG